MKLTKERALYFLKKAFFILFNNKFFPINLTLHNGYHKFAVLFVVGILLGLIALTPYKGEVSTLINSPLIHSKISEREFDERDLQTWINLAAYKRYNEQLTTKFKLPNPKYPLIRKVFENIFGDYIDIEWNNEKVKLYIDQIFPPINIMEINKVIRKTIGSGIKIVTDDEILYEIDLSEMSKEEQIKRLNELKNEYWTISSVVLKSEIEKEEYKVYIDYQTIGKELSDMRVPQELRIAYNSLRLIPAKLDSERFNYEILSNLLDLDKRTILRNYYNFDEKTNYFYLTENISKIDLSTEEIPEEEVKARKELKEVLSFAKFNPVLDFNNVYNRPNFPKSDIKKAIIYKNESKVLRFKPNSRIYVDDNEIPDFIKKAFVLVEDDFFFVNVGGIDPPGLLKATINYILVGAEKGNASIAEQIYEMYLGKKRKAIEDKFVQILFAMYYSYFIEDRNEILSFYIQSIPGSYWGDHCYGIKSITQNYLGKSDLNKLSWKELAWMTRIALLPSVHGIEYARFMLMKKIFEEKSFDIFKEEDVDLFLLLKSNIDLLRFPGDRVRNSKDMKKLIEKYKRSYEITTQRINTALKDFRDGNNFLTPLITEEEYQEALKGEINFVKPDFTNLYQVYTDQTRKDINRIFGKWGWNAGFTITVSLDEAIQTLIDKELEYSTIVAPYFKYWDMDDAPKLGGGAVMIKTHDIKDPNKIENKVIAIASNHPEDTFFNWAVDGYRHFGSIYKWLVLLLYLDQNERGTLFDQYYDIPREFVIDDEDEEITEDIIEPSTLLADVDNENTSDAEPNNSEENENEKEKKDERNLWFSDTIKLLNETIFEERREKRIYRPDNWKLNSREDIFGYYTYQKENNITNFVKSKNVTFVHLSWLTGVELIAEFLNNVSSIDPEKDELRRVYQPYLSTVLGTGESSSIAFAQAASVIQNKGKWKPLSTIEKIMEFDNTEIDIKEEPIQLVSREAAEQAFYVGLINTYIGTARRFIKGGIGKTGTADTDVGFLAMTGRTKNEYIEEYPNHLLNNNLLYLANVGVNSGKLPDGLWGGLNGAYNARDVFRTILGWNGYDGKKEAYKYNISGDLISTFSDKFDFEEVVLTHWSGEYKFKIPVPKNKEVYIEESLTAIELEDIKFSYERYAEVKYMNDTFESIAEGVYSDLNPRIIDVNTLEYTKAQINYNNYLSPFEQYRYSWMTDPNIQFNQITGDFIDRRTGKVIGNSLDILNEGTAFGSSGTIKESSTDDNTSDDSNNEDTSTDDDASDDNNSENTNGE